MLVDTAWKRRRSAWSTQGPRILDEGEVRGEEDEITNRTDERPHSHPATTATRTGSTKRKRSSADDGLRKPPSTVDRFADVGHFPASCEHEFGPLPIPIVAAGSQTRGRDVVTEFPHNLAFRSADWVTNAVPEDQAGYDVVLGWVFLSLSCTPIRL